PLSPPPAVAERPDVEQPTRTVAPPAPKASKPRPSPEPRTDRERRLDRGERRLAEQQAELDARERRLRRKEAPQRTEVPIPDQPAETAPAPDVIPEQPRPESERPVTPESPVTLAAGTKLDVRFNRSLSSATS